MSTKKLAKMAVVTALYVVLTYAFYFMSYGNIQFRIAEILVLLVFYKKDYIIPLVIGTFLANIGSSIGPIDMFVGTLGTLGAVLGIFVVSKFRYSFKSRLIPLFIASLMPVISNALAVGWELNYVFDIPFGTAALWVAIGEFVVVSLVGVTIFMFLEKNKPFMNLITAE